MNRSFVIGLGSNLGSRYALLRAAVELLRAAPGVHVYELSSVYESEAMGPPQPRYLNAAVRIRTVHKPRKLLAITRQIEAELGRVRRKRWGARTVDLDILWAEQGTIRTRDLIVPHPGLRERTFALAPLVEVAPELKDEYGPTIEALGGAPVCRTSLDTEYSCKTKRNGRMGMVESINWDREDALASAITAFSEVIAPPSAHAAELHVRTMARTCQPGIEAEAFVAALLDELATGFSPVRAVITALQAGSVSGRILGRNAPAMRLDPSCIHIDEMVDKGRTRICWLSDRRVMVT
jgi:2-amino-4-hydroxy-6-hydroxymethyldihydropteridine diphosphokinase